MENKFSLFSPPPEKFFWLLSLKQKVCFIHQKMQVGSTNARCCADPQKRAEIHEAIILFGFAVICQQISKFYFLVYKKIKGIPKNNFSTSRFPESKFWPYLCLRKTLRNYPGSVYMHNGKTREYFHYSDKNCLYACGGLFSCSRVLSYHYAYGRALV